MRARLFGNVTESVGEGKWMGRWDDALADVQQPGQALRREQANVGRTHASLGCLNATSSVHSRCCWEHHLHCDETAIRRLKHARAA
eukprot:jgi/Tetstr1/447912/TSEL_035220.t1